MRMAVDPQERRYFLPGGATIGANGRPQAPASVSGEAMNVLWPQFRWGADRGPELAGLGEGIEARFVCRFDEVTDDEWRTADAVVGPSTPLAYLDKLENC